MTLEEKAELLAQQIWKADRAVSDAIIEGRNPTKDEALFTKLNKELHEVCALIEKSNKERK